MSVPSIYLDFASGTPVHPQVLQTVSQLAQAHYHNPDALYADAQQARELLEDYRQRLANFLTVKASSLMFTAGATEANNYLALSLKQTYPTGKLASLVIDHDSFKLHADYQLAVNPQDGTVTEADLLAISDDVCCLSVSGINNELGVIQPFHRLKKTLQAVRQQRVQKGVQLPLLLHVDGSQMVLTHTVQPHALADADFLTLNGGKFYALRPSGLLYIKPPLTLQSVLQGGQQDNSFRPGTPSLPLIAGLAEAFSYVQSVFTKQTARLRGLQAWFEQQLVNLGAEIVLPSANRSPHITVAIFPNYDNETLAFQLSEVGISVGLGSACHAQTDTPNVALQALGLPAAVHNSVLRFSFGYETTQAELATTLKHLKTLTPNLRHEAN